MSTFKIITQKLQWLNKRSSLISQNLANKDVAGYKAKDLKEFTFKSELNKGHHNTSNSSSIDSSVTDSRHLPLGGRGGSSTSAEVVAKSGSLTITGNSVNSDDELQKLNDTSTEYVKMINIYKKNVDWIKSALGKR